MLLPNSQPWVSFKASEEWAEPKGPCGLIGRRLTSLFIKPYHVISDFNWLFFPLIARTACLSIGVSWCIDRALPAQAAFCSSASPYGSSHRTVTPPAGWFDGRRMIFHVSPRIATSGRRSAFVGRK